MGSIVKFLNSICLWRQNYQKCSFNIYSSVLQYKRKHFKNYVIWTYTPYTVTCTYQKAKCIVLFGFLQGFFLFLTKLVILCVWPVFINFVFENKMNSTLSDIIMGRPDSTNTWSRTPVPSSWVHLRSMFIRVVYTSRVFDGKTKIGKIRCLV